MKRICILAALITLIFQQTAAAAGLYWGLSLLAADWQYKNLKVDMRNVAYYEPQKLTLTDKNSTHAFGASFVFGLDFNWAGQLPLRAELETTLLQGSSISAHGQYASAGAVNFIWVDTEVDIELIASESLNLWLEAPKGLLPFRPYLGASIGLNYLPYTAELIFNEGSHNGYAGSDRGRIIGLHYGLGAGAAFQVEKRTFLDLSLRYLKNDTPHTIRLAPANLEFESKSLNLSLGFKYYF